MQRGSGNRGVPCPPTHIRCAPMPANKKTVETGMRVVPKSGGPTLIVRAVSGDQAYCEWFVGTELRQGTFARSALEPLAPEEHAGQGPGQ